MGETVEVLVVSRDLPSAQARFCGAMGIDRIITLSDFDDGAFGESWGLMGRSRRARSAPVVRFSVA
ncbi:MAG: thiol peroxidase [Myxococcota bacterium]|jgi:thiol peroxidase